jgi:hypothetical protein
MKPTLKELILKECYELTKHYVFLHEWFRIFCLNFQVPIIKTLIGAHTLVRHSIREPYNFNLFYSDIDLTFILENENKIRNVLKRLHILKYFMPNIGEPEILLVNEYQNIISHESSLYRTIGQKIFQVRKLTWQYNKLSQTSNPYEMSKIYRGIEKTLNRLNTQTNRICLKSIFPNCPKSKIRLNLNYPFFSDYLECWIEIGECTKELSIICPNIEMADAFLQFIPGNKYEDQSLNHQGLKKYLSYFEIGKSMATFRTKKLEPKEHAQGIAWLETLNKQINEIK